MVLLKFIYPLLIGILAVVVLTISSAGYQRWQEYRHFKEQEVKMEHKLEKAKREYEAQREYAMKLVKDEDYFKWASRNRMGLVPEGEVIVNFEE